MIGFILLGAALLLAMLTIGIAFGRSIERENANDRLARMQAAHDEAMKDLQARVDAVSATSQFMIGLRDHEISELRAEMEAERRKHLAELTKTAPAEWGETEAPTPLTS